MLRSDDVPAHSKTRGALGDWVDHTCDLFHPEPDTGCARTAQRGLYRPDGRDAPARALISYSRPPPPTPKTAMSRDPGFARLGAQLVGRKSWRRTTSPVGVS